MAWYDSIIDFVDDYGEDIVNVGGGIYDIYQQRQLSGQIQDAMKPGGITDPFGAERPQYQQKLSQLYQDPSSLQNLPGYQFRQQMGEQAINRGAAAGGHFQDPNRLYQLTQFNQGLAEQAYESEATRLGNLAGANITPAAGVFDQMLGGLGDVNTATGVSGGGAASGIFDILSTFKKGSGTPSGGGTEQGGIGGLAASAIGMMDTEFDLGIGDSMGGYGTEVVSAAARIAAGEDPIDVAKDAAMDYGKDYLKDQATDWASSLFSGAEAPGAFLSGVGGAAVGTGMGSIGASGLSALGYSALASNAAMGGSLGLAATGPLGAGLAGGATPATLAALNTAAAASGTAGAAGAGAGAGAAGAGAAGSGLGAAAGAVAGPLAIAAVAYMVGSGAYGMYKGSQAKEENRDAYRNTVGQIIGAGTVADPTGLGLGEGYAHTQGGHEFFLPAKHYTSVQQKLTTGEYAGIFDSAAVQGNYAYYKDPTTGEYREGQFAGDRGGAKSFDAGAFQFAEEGKGVEQAQTKHRKSIDDYLVAHGRADEVAGYAGPEMTPQQRWQAQYGEGSYEYTAGGVRQKRNIPEYQRKNQPN